MSRPFRFASPAPSQERPDWGRFVDAKPDAIYNAWPELADPTDFRFPWAQPLARLWYMATTEPEYLVFNLSEMSNAPLVQQVCILHEAIHLLVDVTPAKDSARLHMCKAYTLLLDLLDLATDTWNDRAMRYMNELRHRNELLGQTCAEIEMAEELLATAFSFNAVERQVANRMDMKRYRQSLRDLESDWIAKQEDHLNGFERLYDGFRKVARLVTFRHEDAFPKKHAIAILGWFLEPLSVKGKAVGSFDSQQRCEHLVSAVSRMESGDELLEWLMQELVRCPSRAQKEASGAWTEVLQIWTEQLRCNWVARDLWGISRGKRLEEKDVRNVRQETINFLSGNAPELVERPFAVLSPIPVPDDSPEIWVIAVQSSDVTQKHVPNGRILLLDGLRQQFSRRSGIRCPHAGLESAMCSDCIPGMVLPKEVKQVLHLALWAAEGRFGDGAQAFSPCPYRHGTTTLNRDHVATAIGRNFY